MTDPNMILENIVELQNMIDRQFVGLMVAIGMCSIILAIFINQRTGGRNDRP